MKALNFKSLVLILSMWGVSAYAHPVSFQGATSLMLWNQPYLSDFWAAYSFRPDAAVAARVMRMQMSSGNDMLLFIPQFDYLLKRWNESDHQANIYLYGGYGASTYQGQSNGAGLTGIEADIESRRLFLLGKVESYFTGFNQPFFSGTFRAGFAPYEAEFKELATWIMVQAQVNPMLSRGSAITPMVRLFYKNFLVETGMSLQGDSMFNLMVHF